MKKALPWLVLLGCLALLAGTFQTLLRGRLQKGDVYPPSSSLRSDPLGTMMLYESLAALPGVTVRRDIKDENRLPAGAATTYLHLAASPWAWRALPEPLAREVDRFLFDGGRLVVTFRPEFAPDPKKEGKKDDEKTKESKDSADEENDETETDNEIQKTLKRRKLLRTKLVAGAEPGKPHLVRRVGDGPLPAELTWHGDTILTDLDATWTPIYQREEGVVLAERRRGAGTLIVATDSFLLSNEALVQDRHADLLAWLIGPSRTIVFDEAHLGIVESPGIAALARKYRLHGGAAVLVLLALLYVWKNATSLAPPRTAVRRTDGSIEGRDTVSGFTALLRRNLPKSQLVATCLAEWRKGFARRRHFTSSQRREAEELLAQAAHQPSADPVAVYHAVQDALQRRTTP